MAGKSKHDWAAIHAEFTRSNVSLRHLSQKYKIGYGYICNRSSRERWFEQRDSIQTSAREAVAEELVRRADDQNDQMEAILCKDGAAHMKRSLQTGDRLYTLFQAAVVAMKQGDIKSMRQAIDAWVVLDNQMRKIHNIDDNTDKPLVNINVLAALPSREEREVAMNKAAEAAKAVDV
tara:strand:- start:2370 stop:2900 length:531 start_codon:yes stop_codon:yes gene_type:complete